MQNSWQGSHLAEQQPQLCVLRDLILESSNAVDCLKHGIGASELGNSQFQHYTEGITWT